VERKGALEMSRTILAVGMRRVEMRSLPGGFALIQK
jgi:hypothetical protein